MQRKFTTSTLRFTNVLAKNNLCFFDFFRAHHIVLVLDWLTHFYTLLKIADNQTNTNLTAQITTSSLSEKRHLAIINKHWAPFFFLVASAQNRQKTESKSSRKTAPSTIFLCLLRLVWGALLKKIVLYPVGAGGRQGRHLHPPADGFGRYAVSWATIRRIKGHETPYHFKPMQRHHCTGFFVFMNKCDVWVV